MKGSVFERLLQQLLKTHADADHILPLAETVEKGALQGDPRHWDPVAVHTGLGLGHPVDVQERDISRIGGHLHQGSRVSLRP